MFISKALSGKGGMTLKKLFDADQAHRQVDSDMPTKKLPGLTPELARKLKMLVNKHKPQMKGG